MDKSSDSKLGRNEELSFLYKKLSIRPYVVTLIAMVPEYMDALKSTKETLNDNSVYEIIKKTYLQMCDEGKSYKTARDVMNKVSRDVMGDSSAWKTEC